MKLTTIVKKIVVAAIMSVACFGTMSAHAAYKVLATVPHAYEFGSENPGGGSYYWCGHTALKIAMQYRAGINKTLTQIHNIFTANSPGGYAKNTYCGSVNPGKNWCASLQDLMWAAGLSKNGGYGRTAISQTITSYSTASAMYAGIKQEINAGNPVIILTTGLTYTPCHFWVIVGYSDGYNDATNTIYVRDVAQSAPTNSQYDRTFFAPDFFNASAKQGLVIKGQYNTSTFVKNRVRGTLFPPGF